MMMNVGMARMTFSCSSIEALLETLKAIRAEPSLRVVRVKNRPVNVHTSPPARLMSLNAAPISFLFSRFSPLPLPLSLSLSLFRSSVCQICSWYADACACKLNDDNVIGFRLHPSFDPAETMGYRDVLINVELAVGGSSGKPQLLIAEIQITLSDLLAIKLSGGHGDYRLVRLVGGLEHGSTTVSSSLSEVNLWKIKSGMISVVNVECSFINWNEEQSR